MADDDEPVVRLADFRPAPQIGDPAYADVLDCRPGEIHEFVDSKARAAIDAALADHVKLEHLSQAIEAKRSACRHQHSIIDRKSRTLRCKDCGADIDPFDRIAGIAEGNTRLYRQIVDRDRLERQIKNLRAEVDMIKGEEKRAKSRLAAAKKAREKALRLTDLELYELNLYRDLYDAQADGRHEEARRLRSLIAKPNEQRRKTEADAEPEREADVAVPVSLVGGPDG
jgi:hypothetical protein